MRRLAAAAVLLAGLVVVLASAYRRQVPDPPGVIVPFPSPRSVP